MPVLQPTPALPILTPAQHDPDAMDITMTDGGSDTQANNIQSALSANSRNTPSGRPGLSADNQLSANATSSPMAIPTARAASTYSSAATTGRNDTRTPSPTSGNPALMNGHEGPITPRNDAGPWVFDGSGVRMRLGDATIAGTASLDAAANGGEMILDEIHVRENP
jgi:hypothetical protein